MMELHGHLFRRRQVPGNRAQDRIQNVGGVLTHKIQASERPGIFPAMGRGALEIEAIAGLETVMALIMEPDLKFTAQDVEKFLAFMSIRFAAAARRV